MRLRGHLPPIWWCRRINSSCDVVRVIHERYGGQAAVELIVRYASRSCCGRVDELILVALLAPDGGAPLATRGLCEGGGSGVHTRPKLEIEVVGLLARKGELASAPGTTSTRPLGGRTKTPEFDVPSKSRTSRFRSVKKIPTSLVYAETKMSTHKHFEACIEIHSLSPIVYTCIPGI